MSKSTPRSRRPATRPAEAASDVARAGLALRSAHGTFLHGVDFGIDQRPASVELRLWLEAELPQAIPAGAIDGLYLLRATTDHPGGVVTRPADLHAIRQELRSGFASVRHGRPAWTEFTDVASSTGRRTQVAGLFTVREQLPTLVGALRAEVPTLDPVTILDGHIPKVCYEFLQGLDTWSLAQAIERDFGLTVSEPDQHSSQPAASGQSAGHDLLSRPDLTLEAATRELASSQNAFRQRMADELAPAVNRFIATHRQTTVEEKREVAHAINRSLKELGLALRCPKSGLPALLTLVDRASEGAESRYFYDARVPDSGRKRRTFSVMRLESVDVMPDLPRREGFSLWRDRVEREADEGQDKKKSR